MRRIGAKRATPIFYELKNNIIDLEELVGNIMYSRTCGIFERLINDACHFVFEFKNSIPIFHEVFLSTSLIS